MRLKLLTLYGLSPVTETIDEPVSSYAKGAQDEPTYPPGGHWDNCGNRRLYTSNCRPQSYSWRRDVGSSARRGLRCAYRAYPGSVSRQHADGRRLRHTAMGRHQHHRIAAGKWTDAGVERGTDAVTFSLAGGLGAIRSDP